MIKYTASELVAAMMGRSEILAQICNGKAGSAFTTAFSKASGNSILNMNRPLESATLRRYFWQLATIFDENKYGMIATYIDLREKPPLLTVPSRLRLAADFNIKILVS